LDEAIFWYAFKGMLNSVGLIDSDLTAEIKNAWDDGLGDCLKRLAIHKWSGYFCHTFTNKRDSFHGVEERIAWLRTRLPSGIEYVAHDPYSSNWQDRRGVWHRGDAMCMVTLRGRQ
jgi:hypothetical protein